MPHPEFGTKPTNLFFHALGVGTSCVLIERTSKQTMTQLSQVSNFLVCNVVPPPPPYECAP
jgi:hypothetical protein